MLAVKATALAVLFSFSACAFAQVESISLGSRNYNHASSATQEGASLHEYVIQGERLSDWTSLITIQCHPKASLIGDALNPYLKNRQAVLLAAPQFLKSPNDGSDGLIMVVALGEKGARTFEFVIGRFIQASDFGVLAVIQTTKHSVARNVRIDSKETQTAIENFDLALAKSICTGPSD